MSGLRVEKVVTSGTFSIDGGTWEVENNVWIVGDDSQCDVIDAAHDAEAILAAVGDRTLTHVLCTHGHDDHIDAVADIRAARPDVQVLINDADRMLWDRVVGTPPEGGLDDGQVIPVAGSELRVLHTPGHSPGACCLLLADEGVVFSGDTLFQGGPGATGRSFSDFPTIVDSIRQRLLTLPPETVVHTGHGDDTTIGAEAPHVQEWLDRGH
ncbi:MBL fold metallo-hydrolase [Rudaeicoccus suwonensis]|uniref:Glyoxylase-like metal-dependent hydrolase (Beta-lactamase superfamily II) n=1 Tax=Rudaeicoccus suwonensis TaxID=657409 RepID=A0A561E7P3_9MICO|nr:MBL fold metallo-hydrolase [Rudaeicoccus suwonensis]TWE11632.1 glyoxylase-like metal-dependent hydrolase (beta-lactamase superfamily II) [Rudaeicoccus suwonensis]